MRLVGFVLLGMLVGYGLSAGLGDQLMVLVSPSSMIYVWGGAGLILLMVHGKRGWSEFIRVVRFKSGEMDEEAKAAASGFLETGSRAALAMGGFWVLFGVIILGTNMDDPVVLGPGMVMAILPLLYGIVLSEMVFVLMRKSLMRKR